MSITMRCDACKEVVHADINGGVRLKMGKKEYIFHLCGDCQEKLRQDIKDGFLGGAAWRETS